MACWFFIFGIFGFFWHVSGDNKYENYTLMRIYPQTEEKLETVIKFQDPEGEVEMLKNSRGVNDSLDVLVPQRRMNFMKEFVSDHNIMFDKQENYGRNFEEEEDRTPRRRVMNEFNLFSYHSYNDMLSFINTITAKHPGLVTQQTYGRSYEGRPMVLVKISSNPNAKNPIIFVDAGIHAREWVSSAMALYMIHRLATDPDSRTGMLNGVDWYILPVVNPDGYEYSRSSPSNRLWRKNRSRYSGCSGVDCNRNYGYKWAVSGEASTPCQAETYPGPHAFSEPETRLVRDIMKENGSRMKLYVTLHSYGQYLVYPWGYTGRYLPPTWHKLDEMARKVSGAVVRAGGLPFRILSAGKWYPAAGGSDDYAFGAVNIPYSYTMELTEGYEFTYPKNLLGSALPQFYEGFREFGSQIRKEFGNK